MGASNEDLDAINNRKSTPAGRTPNGNRRTRIDRSKMSETDRVGLDRVNNADNPPSTPESRIAKNQERKKAQRARAKAGKKQTDLRAAGALFVGAKPKASKTPKPSDITSTMSEEGTVNEPDAATRAQVRNNQTVNEDVMAGMPSMDKTDSRSQHFFDEYNKRARIIVDTDDEASK